MLEAQNLAAELNTDDDLTTLQSLLNQAQIIVDNALDTDTYSQATLEADGLYVRAVYTLATQLYYDRTLADGMSNGLQMMLVHLQSRFGGESDGDNGSTVSDEKQTDSSGQGNENQS